MSLTKESPRTMKDRRAVTVNTSIRFNGMLMDSTDAALDIIKGVMAELGEHCHAEIKQALEDAGAKDVTIGMTAY